MAALFAVAAGNWSDTATWATTSGGSPGAAVPTVLDDVTIDANTPAGTVTVDVASSVNTVTLDNADVELLDVAGLTVVGEVTQIAGVSNRYAQVSWGSLSSDSFTGSGDALAVFLGFVAGGITTS